MPTSQTETNFVIKDKKEKKTTVQIAPVFIRLFIFFHRLNDQTNTNKSGTSKSSELLSFLYINERSFWELFEAKYTYLFRKLFLFTK